MASRRDAWLPQAISCFLAQDWAEKELVIVAEYPKPEGLPDSVRWIEVLPVPGMLSIGYRRNVAVSNARGAVIIHFDDDDQSYPGRITDQVSRLESTGKSVTGYHSLKFHDGEKWFQYRNDSNWAFDTSLCYRKSFWQKYPFAPINDGLEAGFRDAAIREGQFISVDGSEMMHATIHAGNTGPRIMTPGNLNWTEL